MYIMIVIRLNIKGFQCFSNVVITKVGLCYPTCDAEVITFTASIKTWVLRTDSAVNPFPFERVLRALIDFTLSNARRFYSSMGNLLDGKGLRLSFHCEFAHGASLFTTMSVEYSSKISVKAFLSESPKRSLPYGNSVFIG